MFCKHCGSELPEGASFCVTCGKKITADAPYGAEKATESASENEFTYAPANTDFDFSYTYTEPTPAAPASAPRDEARDAHGGRILLFSILALAFSLSFYLAIVGTVFFIIAKVQLGRYLAKYGETEGRASVGKALSVAATPVNIVMMVFFTVFVIVLALGLA